MTNPWQRIGVWHGTAGRLACISYFENVGTTRLDYDDVPLTHPADERRQKTVEGFLRGRERQELNRGRIVGAAERRGHVEA